jgi:predicted DNA-binding transcriptional regulator AlpA
MGIQSRTTSWRVFTRPALTTKRDTFKRLLRSTAERHRPHEKQREVWLMALELVREASPPVIEPRLTAKEVAAILRIREKAVYALGIPCERLTARRIRWRRCDVEAWLEQRRSA